MDNEATVGTVDWDGKTYEIDRTARARAEAERQIHVYGDDFKARTLRANLNDAFVQGVEWADANPQPHTITRGQLAHAAWMLQMLSEDKIAAVLPGLLGIEVTDDE